MTTWTSCWSTSTDGRRRVSDAGSSPQRISGVYNVGGGPHLGSGLTIDTAAKILRDTT
ncbi:hypothetical protein OG462_03650 [Streptomyces sp. NBC_01077]|nr:hypothetical protein OG462_03650 [Streptomyces sp. NBC_01077]